MSKIVNHAALPEGWIKAGFKEGEPVNEAAIKWSGKGEPPAIGSVVKIKMNGLGEGLVKGYFVQDNWLGVLVELSDPPDWWKKQNAKFIAKGDSLSHIFGAELG